MDTSILPSNILIDDEMENPLIRRMGRLTGILSADEILGASLRSSFVSPGDIQVVKRWHTDMFRIISCSNTLTTEFLIADEDVMDKFIKSKATHLIDDRPRNYGPNYYGAIANLIQQRMQNDDELLKFGFNIWTPQPTDIVYSDFRHVHRSQANNTNEKIKRCFASIILKSHILQS